MKFLNHLLLRLGLGQIDAPRVRRWISERDTRSLILALQHARDYRTRLLVLEQLNLSYLRDQQLVLVLARLVREDFPEVAEKALRLLQRSLYNLELTAHIQAARKVYEDRLRREANRREAYEDYRFRPENGVLVDKSKMKMLEKVKQQLKKPMR